MKFAILILSALTGLVFLQGCAADISGDPRYSTGFEKGHVYVTQRDLNGTIDHTLLFRNSRSIELLKAPALPPYKSASEELVLVPKGTEILVKQVILDHTGDGTEMSLLAEFSSGAFKGKGAILENICDHKKFSGAGMFASLAVRDPEFLVEK